MARPFLSSALSVICIACVIASADAQTPPAADDDGYLIAPTPAGERDENSCPACDEEGTLTGGWFGAGRELERQGISIALVLTQLYQQNVSGGQSTHRHSGRYTGRYDLEIEAHLERLINLPGGRIYALAQGGWSSGINESSIGSLHEVNSLAIGERSIDVWELYYEQSFFDDKAFLRIGKVDLTGGFECRSCPGSFDGNMFANDETGQFLNDSLTNNPTIPFPDPGLGIILHVQPTHWLYLSAAVADADADVRETGFNTAFHGPSNTFSIFEAGLLPYMLLGNAAPKGVYRIGMWYDPQLKERLDESGCKRDDVGFYISADQMIWKLNSDEDSTQGIGIFGRYGIANADVNEIKSFWSAGVQCHGLIPGRDEDIMSFGVGQGRLSRQSEDFTTSHETVLEWYYKIAITPWLHVSPDVQYIMNPGGDASVKDAVVIGFRVGLTF